MGRVWLAGGAGVAEVLLRQKVVFRKTNNQFEKSNVNKHVISYGVLYNPVVLQQKRRELFAIPKDKPDIGCKNNGT